MLSKPTAFFCLACSVAGKPAFSISAVSPMRILLTVRAHGAKSPPHGQSSAHSAPAYVHSHPSSQHARLATFTDLTRSHWESGRVLAGHVRCHETPPRTAPFGAWPGLALGATAPPRRGRSRRSRRSRSPPSTSTRPCSSSASSTRWSSNRGDGAARPQWCRRVRPW